MTREAGTMNRVSVKRAEQWSARVLDPLVSPTRVMVTSKREGSNLLWKATQVQSSSEVYEVTSALPGRMLNKQWSKAMIVLMYKYIEEKYIKVY